MAAWTAHKYLMVLGLFLVMMMELGILKAFSVLVNDITVDLNISMSFFGMVIGMCHALSIGLGVFHIPLLRRYSYRQLIMTGSTVSSMCYMAVSLAKSPTQLAMCFIMASVGNAVVNLPSHTAASVFFPEAFEVVTGIIFAGSGVGMMVFPVMIDIFNTIYGWRGATMLLGAFAFHSTLGGALLRPMAPSDSRDILTSDENSETLPLALEQKIAISTGKDRDRKDDEKTDTNVFTKLVTYFDLIIVRDHPKVLLCLVLFFLYYFINVTWYVFVVPNAIAKGIAPQSAATVAVVGGIGNTIGRFTIGIVSSFKIVGDDVLLSALNILSAVAFVCNIEARTLLSLASIAAVTGFCLGALTALLSIFVRGMVPTERFPAAITLASFLPAFGEPFGGALMGYLYDVTASFDLSYVIVGITHLVFILFTMIPRILEKCKSV